jgi:hypothetical protein
MTIDASPATLPSGAEPTGEWLFRKDGQVYGPVPAPRLVELLYEGQIDPRTAIAPDGGAWAPLEQVPGFLVHARKAEAQARVEQEVTGRRQLARRRSVLQGSVALALALALGGAAAAGAAWLAMRRPWERRSALLEEFGDGVALASVRVGGGARARTDDEVAIPEGPAPSAGAAAPAPGAGARRAAPPRAAPRTLQGGLVLAQYDAQRIQAVVARRQGTLAPCLREEAARSPDFAGEIPVEFAVGNDGRVAQLWIDEPRFKQGALRDCLVGKLREWAFEAFPGERPVVSISFQIGSGSPGRPVSPPR